MNTATSTASIDKDTACAAGTAAAAPRVAPVRIDIEQLTLSFGETTVLKGIDLSIEPGEFFAFLGPSGSGKTTLLRAIAGFGPTPRGRILIDGADIAGRMPWQRDVGMVFQSYALWPHLNVARNVAYGLEERRVARPEIKARVHAALELVGMADYALRYPSQLSGGQQQRIALARTIAVEPRVLLLDEPLSNLDAGLRVQMRQELLQLQRRLGITTIFVTHDQEEANTICDRIAVLSAGVVQQVGRPADVYDNPVNEFVARFLGTANIIAGHTQRTAAGIVFASDTGTLRLPLADDAGEGRGHLVIRPQGISVAPAPSEQTIAGTVRSAEFLGGATRYNIEANQLALLVDIKHIRGAPDLRTGDQVALSIPPAQAIFLAA
ncbi:ABC transporter ATP-binding protein [Candidimonas nitroreducens]|uniref:Polyamine ABC transporter ATP-binding protein n=1 Tax=Candidimonas nitroreducens TaxID=683354 RepID=A0A225MTC6_9BURK|nr:ABC transporter ATP-binding protein [Candidimonas nitroreducens]OWT63713.1 polyamine ABC transporter ATP-binding protein [Candidimonas nitroreducens]